MMVIINKALYQLPLPFFIIDVNCLPSSKWIHINASNLNGDGICRGVMFCLFSFFIFVFVALPFIQIVTVCLDD